MRFRETDVAQVVPDHDETAGVVVRQRANQDRIDGAEHGRIRADPERQRGDGDARERRIAAHLPQGVADIACELLQVGPHAHFNLVHR